MFPERKNEEQEDEETDQSDDDTASEEDDETEEDSEEENIIECSDIIKAPLSPNSLPTCYICLNEFDGQEVGSPDSCENIHHFCLECLEEWSKVFETIEKEELILMTFQL